MSDHSPATPPRARRHRTPATSTHDTCGVVTYINGRPVRCGKSPEHTQSQDPTRREHFDPGADERWSDDQ